VKAGEVVLLSCCAAAGILWVSSPLTLPYWQGRAPGSAFLPFWIGASTLVTLALLLMARFRRVPASGAALDGASASPPAQWRKPALVMAALLACIALLEPLGFVIATLAFSIFLARVVERRNWPETAAVGAATLGIAVLFHQGLGVPLPSGPLGF
jgi:hypothetical protein